MTIAASLLLAACAGGGPDAEDAPSTCGYLYTVKGDGPGVTAGGCSGSLQEQYPGPEVHVRVGHDVTVAVAKGTVGLPLPTPAGPGLRVRRHSRTSVTYRAVRAGEVRLEVSTIYCNGPSRGPEPTPVAHTCPVARVVVGR